MTTSTTQLPTAGHDASAGENNIETAIARFETATPDEIAETLVKIESAMKRAKEWDAAAKAALTDRIKASGGKELPIGSDIWRLTRDKKVKCRDKAKALNAAMELAGGDMEAMARDYFASEPFKQGSMHKAMDDARFEELFETSYDESCEKKLTRVDPKFIR